MGDIVRAVAVDVEDADPDAESSSSDEEEKEGGIISASVATWYKTQAREYGGNRW
jgi:hypothetical protein